MLEIREGDTNTRTATTADRIIGKRKGWEYSNTKKYPNKILHNILSQKLRKQRGNKWTVAIRQQKTTVNRFSHKKNTKYRAHTYKKDELT